MHTHPKLAFLGLLLFLTCCPNQSYSQVDSLILADTLLAQDCFLDAYRVMRKDPLLANAYLEQVLTVFVKQKNMRDYCGVLIGLSTTHYALGDFELAYFYAQKGTEENRKYMGEKHYQYMFALGNLAATARNMGKWNESVSVFKEAIKVAPHSKTVTIPMTFAYLHQIGITYRQAGDVPKALQFYEQALSWKNKHPEHSFGEFSGLLLSKGWAHLKIFEWEGAKNTYRQLLKVGKDHEVSSAYFGLADASLGLQELDSAVYFVNKGVEFTEKRGKQNTSRGEEILGKIYKRKNDLENALLHYQNALSLRKKTGTQVNRHLGIAEYHTEIGKLHHLQKSYQKSLEHFHLATSTLCTGMNGQESWQTIPSLDSVRNPQEIMKLMEEKANSLFKLYKESEEIEHLNLAFNHIATGTALIERIAELQASEEGQILLSQRPRSMVEQGIQIAQLLWEQNKQDSYLWEALNFVESIKSRILKEELENSKIASVSQLPDSFRIKFHELQESIGFYTQQISSFDQKKYSNPFILEKWKNQLFELEQKRDDFVKHIESNYSIIFKKDIDDFPKKIQDLQSSLPKNSLLLEYFWGEAMLYIFIISNSSIEIKTVPVDKVLLQQIASITQLLHEPNMSQEGLLEFVSSSSQLSTFLAIDEGFQKVESFYIVPDGPLSYLPFEVLLSKDPGDITQMAAAQAYRKLPYLFQSHSIHYLHAASLIDWESGIKKKGQQNLGAFAPSYSGKLALKLNKSSSQNIEKLIGGELFFDEHASEHAFKSEANHFKSLHLAVHGNADVDLPINAYLDFGQGGNQKEDGRLYAYELHAMSLPADLVSLIACDAGYGKLEKGEGVMSLARAFRMAGAKTILTSLWKADGRAAAPISESFYAQLKQGKRPSKALQEAKQSFLQEASPDLVHPYYWATYVLTGNDEVVWINYFLTYLFWIPGFIILLLGTLVWRKRNKKITRN